ncbi:Dual specificity phosphatase [Parasponia andersonii]|uniref:Dual specificity phosphatase n=1 Tax=Parasponia andersonii TaxID=3476 RepID=A0A2P5AG74_PARAD|nr:Dual specificity phosphatase [Parasponia andersonii]
MVGATHSTLYLMQLARQQTHATLYLMQLASDRLTPILMTFGVTVGNQIRWDPGALSLISWLRYWTGVRKRRRGLRGRGRENPCAVCGHYHNNEEGEVCEICGHGIPVSSEKTSIQVSAFPSEIFPEFLYLGSYDNASRSEHLKTQGISRVLNVRF